MHVIFGGLLALSLVAGCSFTPSKPPQCQGDFRPVNRPAYPQSATTMSTIDSLALCTKGVGHAKQG